MADEDATLLIPRVTRRDKRLASKRRVPWAWIAYSGGVVLVVVGAAFLAVR